MLKNLPKNTLSNIARVYYRDSTLHEIKISNDKELNYLNKNSLIINVFLKKCRSLLNKYLSKFNKLIKSKIIDYREYNFNDSHTNIIYSYNNKITLNYNVKR